MGSTLMWVLARAAINTRACPDCGAAKGERCLSLKDASWRAERSFIAQPHARRYPAGNRLINAPENAALIEQNGEQA